jgi:hypothetical protein
MKRFLLMVISPVLLVGTVRADMRWTTQMKVDTGAIMGRAGGASGLMAAMGEPVISFTTAVKEGAQRKESKVEMGMFSTNDVTLTLCEKKQLVQIDDSLKIYTISPLTGNESGFVNPMAGMGSALAGIIPPGMNIPGVPSAKPGPPAEGKIISTITMEDLGEETIAETPTRHWMVTIKNEKFGCAGNGTDTTKMEVWAANSNELVVCPQSSGSNPVRDLQNALKPNCKITFESKGDGQEAFGKIFRGLVMRMKMLDPKTNKPSMTQEVTMLTRARQDDNLFAIPAGYREVKAGEFQKLKGQAMLQKIFQGGLPPGLGQ